MPRLNPLPPHLLTRDCLLNPALPVLAGISGGPDSLCLLGVLRQANFPVIVAHLNHALRPSADQEAATVAELARSLGLPFLTQTVDVRAFAKEHGLSIEEAARNLRYRFLFSAAVDRDAQAVAVGHTADDQVETLLMHLLRGTGLAGLKGMQPRSFLPVFSPTIPLVRPLLSLWRTDTESYCRQHGLTPHYDTSNNDEHFFRNRLRHSLIPELEKYNPHIKDGLLRTSLALQGDHELLQADVEEVFEQALASQGPGWLALHAPLLRACPPAMCRNLFRHAAETLLPASHDASYTALQRAADFAASSTSRQIDFFNGLILLLEGNLIYITQSTANLPGAGLLAIDGQKELLLNQPLSLGNGYSLLAQEEPAPPPPFDQHTDPFVVWISADDLPGPLCVRPRLLGDVFRPLGMGGQGMKMREFYIKVKLPVRARAQWPLLCSGSQVVWVPGYRLAHAFRLTPKTQRILKLEVLVLKKEQAAS